jgi:hypothetical protein
MAFKKRKSSSPLGRHLNTRFAGKKRIGKKRAIFGAAIIVLVPYIGTSLAASVAISGANNSTAIEFAQGSQVTVACDTSIATALDSSFYSSGPYFKVDTITLSDVNVTAALSSTTSNQGCGNKNFTLTVYTAAGLATIGSNSGTQVTFAVPTSGTSVTVSTSPVNTGITAAIAITSGTGVITLTLPAGINLNASDVTRVGIETS